MELQSLLGSSATGARGIPDCKGSTSSSWTVPWFTGTIWTRNEQPFNDLLWSRDACLIVSVAKP